MTSRPIYLLCPTCLGRNRTQSGIQCAKCLSFGWIVKPLDQLTPKEAAKLRSELQEIPPDSETAYTIESVREQLTKLLTRCWIESISFPADDNTRLIVHSRRTSLEIFPEFLAGKFIGLNVIPLSDPPASTNVPA